MKSRWQVGALVLLFGAGGAVAMDPRLAPVAQLDEQVEQDDTDISWEEEDRLPPIGADDVYDTEGFDDYQEPGIGGSGTEMTPPPAESWQEPQSYEPTGQMEEDEDRGLRDTLNVKLGGGVEGYSAGLGDTIDTGPAWGAVVGVQPLTWLGAELGYTGAVNELDSSIAAGGEGAVNGADLVRNGGTLNLTANLPIPFFQPYALAGIGFDRYNFRGGAQQGLSDDTTGRVPLGGGLRTKVGPFTADARAHYNVIFDQDFAPQVSGAEDSVSGSYTALLQLGGRF